MFRAVCGGTMDALRVTLPAQGVLTDTLAGEEVMLRFIEPTEGTAVRKYFCSRIIRGMGKSVERMGWIRTREESRQ